MSVARVAPKPRPWPGGRVPDYVLELLADDPDPEVAAEARAELEARAADGPAPGVTLR